MKSQQLVIKSDPQTIAEMTAMHRKLEKADEERAERQRAAAQAYWRRQIGLK